MDEIIKTIEKVIYTEDKLTMNYIDIEDEECHDFIEAIELLVDRCNYLENITICGRTLDEAYTIISGLEAERITNIEMTMKNIHRYMEWIKKDQEKAMQEAFKRQIEQFDWKLSEDPRAGIMEIKKLDKKEEKNMKMELENKE